MVGTGGGASPSVVSFAEEELADFFELFLLARRGIELCLAEDDPGEAIVADAATGAGGAAVAGEIAPTPEETRVLRVPVGATVSRAGKEVGGRILSTSSDTRRPCSSCRTLRAVLLRISICLR